MKQVRDAEAVGTAEGSIRSTDMARGAGIPRCRRTQGTYVRTAPGPGRSPCHPAVVAGSL